MKIHLLHFFYILLVISGCKTGAYKEYVDLIEKFPVALSDLKIKINEESAEALADGFLPIRQIIEPVLKEAEKTGNLGFMDKPIKTDYIPARNYFQKIAVETLKNSTKQDSPEKKTVGSITFIFKSGYRSDYYYYLLGAPLSLMIIHLTGLPMSSVNMKIEIEAVISDLQDKVIANYTAESESSSCVGLFWCRVNSTDMETAALSEATREAIRKIKISMESDAQKINTLLLKKGKK